MGAQSAQGARRQADVTRAGQRDAPIAGAAFYCASSELYFPGAVALINSLRLHGHDEPIFLLDCGLTPAHRRLLEQEATIVAGKPDTPPYLLKTIAPRLHPAETMMLIDVDMVVTKPLTPLFELASPGRVVAFENDAHRFVAEWGELLELGPTTRRPYVSSGLVVLGGELGSEVLRLWHDRQGRVDYERSYFGRDEPGYPFRFLDQDVLNAILCTSLGSDELAVIEQRLAAIPPFGDLRVLDEKRLRCAYPDGAEPYVIHHFERKPWLVPIYHGLYSRLLSRLWLGSDVALPLPRELVPLRMRNGILARAERARVDTIDVIRRYVLKRPAAAP